MFRYLDYTVTENFSDVCFHLAFKKICWPILEGIPGVTVKSV